MLGTWALDQAKALQRQDGCDVEVISLTPWLPDLPFMSPGYRAYANCPLVHRWDNLTVRYPRWPLYSIGPLFKAYHRNPDRWLSLAWRFSGRRILAMARAYGPDVIFAHHTCVNGGVAMRLSKALDVPFVTQDHSYGDMEMCERFPRRRQYFGEVGRKAAGMLVVSCKMATDLQRIAPGARIGILYNGSNLPRDPGTVKLAGARGRTVFGVGMLVERKGFAVLLRAWAEVVKRFPDAKLRIAGDGPEKPTLDRIRRELGLEASVELLGYLSHDLVLEEMRNSRVFALPSWNEPFAVVYMEALSAGCSIVWGQDGGVGDVLSDGLNGYSVPPRNEKSIVVSLLRLLGDDASACQIGDRNRALSAAQFTWDAVTTQLAMVLREARSGSFPS